MIKRFENKILMLDGVHAFLTENSHIVSENRGLVMVKEDLKKKTDEIRNAENLRINICKGKTEAKKVIRRNIISMGLLIASKLYNFANKSGNAELKSQSDITRTSLIRCRDTELIIVILKIAENAEENLNALNQYGLTEEMLITFKSLLAEFRDSLDSKSTSEAMRISVRKTLSTLFRESGEILKTIDMAVEGNRESNFTFYIGYKSVRELKELGKRYRDQVETISEPEITEVNKTVKSKFKLF